MKPTRHAKDDLELEEILKLIRESFAYMDGRVDPPSSVHDLTLDAIAKQCLSGEVWSLGVPLKACMFLSLKENAIYIGKLAVSDSERRKGIGHSMIELAETRAKALGKKYLELYTRIELVENHAAFTKMGFEKEAEASHPGYDRPTYLIMRKPVS